MKPSGWKPLDEDMCDCWKRSGLMSRLLIQTDGKLAHHRIVESLPSAVLVGPA